MGNSNPYNMRANFKRTNRIKYIRTREIDNKQLLQQWKQQTERGNTMVESAVKQAYEVAKRDTPQLALTQMPSSKITRS